MEQPTCGTCNGPKSKHDRGKQCSRCKYARRPRIPCSECSEPTGYPITDKRAPSVPRCRACQRQRKGPKGHGTSGYGYGCRCEVCTIAQRDSCREYKRRRRAEGRPTKKDKNWAGWISKSRRLALYERDGWTCQICLEPVDREVVNGRRAPSLDHIVPRSLGGTHADDNLRTACMSCNASRGNRV